MLEIRDHVLLRPGKFAEYVYTKESIKKMQLPKEMPVTIGFSTNPKDLIGIANNFRKIDNAIVCDIEITDKAMSEKINKFALGIAPEIEMDTTKIKLVENCEITKVSLVAKPIIKDNIIKLSGVK